MLVEGEWKIAADYIFSVNRPYTNKRPPPPPLSSLANFLTYVNFPYFRMHAFEEKFANSNRTPKRELILFHTVQLRIFYNRTMPRHCKSTYSDNRVDTASALINIYFNDNRICKLQFYHTKLCISSLRV